MTDAERLKLERCQAALGPCVENRHELLAGFLKGLGEEDAAEAGDDAGRFVPAVSEWLEAHPVAPAEAGFVLLRVALLIGETLVQRFDGQWLLDDNPASPHFASYAVGAFTGIPNQGAAVNPFAIARDYVVSLQSRDAAAASHRDLASLVSDVEAALRGA